MTVQELILKLIELQDEDKSKKVIVEGCDCYRDARSIDNSEVDKLIITSVD